MSEIPDPPDGDELARLDAQIPLLRAEYDRTRRAFEIASAALREAEERRRWLTSALVTSPSPVAPASPNPTPVPVAPVPVAPVPVAPFPVAPPADPTGPETSTRTVQNVLFILGGILLGTAAIVFTAVAWATFGIAGRAAILTVVTALALAAPLLALRRQLRATAETFAGIGLLLLGLDGYAMWHVNLLGVQGLGGRDYVGTVLAVVVAFAFGYGWLTRLAGPVLVAVVAAQPVVPLLVSTEHPTLAGTSLLASGVAAGNALVAAAIVRGLHSGTARWSAAVLVALRFLAFAAFSGWAVLAGVNGLAAEILTDTLPGRVVAGVATVVFSLVALLGAWASRRTILRTVAAGMVVGALAVAGFATAVFVWPDRLPLLFAGTALGIAVLVRFGCLVLPQWLRPGPRIAAATVCAASLLFLAALGALAARTTIEHGLPFWDASLVATGPHPPLLTWELPVSIGVATAAALVVGAPTALVLGGWVLVTLALPASVALPWWAPPALDLAGLAVLAAGYRFARRTTRLRSSILVGGAVLVLDAVLTSAARPGLTALTLTGVLVLGVAIAVAIRTRTVATPDPADGPTPRGDAVGAAALAVGLLAAPPAVGSALRAWDVAPSWALRATVAAGAALLLAMVAVRRLTRSGSTVDSYLAGAFWATVLSVGLWPLGAAAIRAEPIGIYCGAALLVLALAVVALPVEAVWARWVALLAGSMVGLTFAGAVVPTVLAVSVLPYGWLFSIWSGAPTGTGLTVPGVGAAAVPPRDAVALALLALTAVAGTYAVRRRFGAAIAGLALGGPTAVLAAVVAAGAQWPGLPFASLAIGLTLLLPTALVGDGTGLSPWRATVLTGQGVLYLGAGVAGSLAERWTTLCALGLLVVAFGVLGVAGRTSAWRVTSCAVAVVAAIAEAATAGAAATLGSLPTAFAVLGVGTLALFAGALLRRNPARRPESVASEAAAFLAPVVALVIGAQSSARAALIVAIWGLALGGRAIVPAATRGVRSAYAAAGGGLEVVAWWLLIAGYPVPVEAYTLPLAAVTLFAGWARLRARPEVRSWVAYGPALLAGFLPTLAVVLGTAGSPGRRLALGAAALVCVVAGAIRRRQAPVVVGGVVLGLVAVHELALLWQMLPGWIPLAAGGAILIFLAITYERRRRDLHRVRTALRQMT